MALAKIVTLNEFFVRMTDDGTAIQGVHVADMERILEDGALVSAKMLQPRSVDANDSAALGPIASAFNLAALATVDSQVAQIATLTADKATLTADKVAAEAARDAAIADKAALADQLAALQPVVNGVPQFVKKWQLLAGLRIDGIYTPVMAYINALPAASLDLWNGSAGVERDSPFLVPFKTQFGKTDADLDSMFTRYAAITQADVLALG